MSRPPSQAEIRRCTFRESQGQPIYVDKGGTAVIESCGFENARISVFVADPGSAAQLRESTITGCTDVGMMAGNGSQLIADGNAVCPSRSGLLAGIGIGAYGAGTRVEVSGGRLEAKEKGIGLTDGASLAANGVAIIGGDLGASARGRGSYLNLRDCRVSDPASAGIKAEGGATLVVERGEVRGANGGVLADNTGTKATIRGASIHGNRGPGIVVGADVEAVLEDNDVFDNAFPGIATIGGHLRALRNRVHDNRSNGIAIRVGADAVVEGNDVWGNEMPAITIVGAGTHAALRENTVHDNVGQGIYVYQGASAEIIGNRLTGNGQAAITISDRGASATVAGNVVRDSHGPGIWVADGASATLEHNELLKVDGTAILTAGLVVDHGATVEARDNVVRDAPIGVVVRNASGSFVKNQLRGNTAGSWCLIDPVRVTRDGNEEETLALPGWAAPLDAGRYVLLALRVGAELRRPPQEVEGLGSSLLSLPSLAAKLGSAEVGDYVELIQAHLAAEMSANIQTLRLADSAERDPQDIRARIVAHLAVASEISGEAITRPTFLPGIVETLAVRGDSGSGVPLRDAEMLGTPDELFALGEARIRAGLKVEQLPRTLVDTRAFAISGPYSGAAAVLHLAEWCPQTLGKFGALVALGNAERIVVMPVEDSSIVYALPSLIGITSGSWTIAAWKLRPILAWVSADRTDIFEIDVAPGGTPRSVTVPSNLAMLLARLPEPADRIPEGWESEIGLPPADAARLVSIVRLELLERLTSDASQLTSISPRTLVDIASDCRGTPQESWPGRVRAYFDVMVAERRVLDRLTDVAPYEEVRPHLWMQINRAASKSMIERAIVGGLTCSLLVASGPRTRLVSTSKAAAWGVPEERPWDDAAQNVLAAPVVSSSPGGPVVKLGIRDHEGEAIGLLLHRRPDACPNGYLVGLVHKGAAYAIELRDRGALENMGPFAKFLESIYQDASRFDDELSRHMFWLEPDGVLVDLFDCQKWPPKGGLPTPFLTTMASRGLIARGQRVPKRDS